MVKKKKNYIVKACENLRQYVINLNTIVIVR